MLNSFDFTVDGGTSSDVRLIRIDASGYFRCKMTILELTIPKHRERQTEAVGS